MATFWVTNTDDDGAGSLRDAVEQANARRGGDVIRFSADFDGGAEDLIRLTSGQIEITDRLTIKARAAGAVITGDALGDDVTVGGITDVAASLAGDDRLDDNSRIFDATAAITLDGLTLSGGRTTGDRESGGAVRGMADITVINSNLSGNSTAGTDSDGGAVYVRGYGLNLVGSIISGNSARGDGGGISSSWVAYVANSALDNNMAGGRGGGIYGYYVHVSDSAVRGNSAVSAGGGIRGFDTSIVGSIVSDNIVRGDKVFGGGVSAGYLDVSGGSVISGNIAEGVSSAEGGGLRAFYSADVTGSTVSGNSASAPDARGGGIFSAYYSGVTLKNSTVSGNIASGNYAGGGGVSAGVVEAINSTISGNVSQGAVSIAGGVQGNFSGYYAELQGYVTLKNSIVLGNATLGGGGDELVSDTITLVGGNILSGDRFVGETDVGDVTAAEVFAGVTEIASGVFAGLLGDNGGPTQTIAIRRGGPAAGAADPASAEATDQRGNLRDAAPDLGAYEATDAPLTLTGGPNADFLVGEGLADRLRGKDGDDILRGLGGDDTLIGDLGADSLRGGAGNDDLRGGAGEDWIAGGGGDDLLSGGAGADIFVFGGALGADEIVDFDANPAGGQDLIDLRGLGITAASFALEVAIRDLGPSVGITILHEGTITLTGVGDSSTVDRTDFLLA
ncbi:choice-of-anchor Q domain-containing protein [Amaricoccus sp.]|uniref:calcium-binding protein n=1 Tax=Amaricoccus sp. TaxID=1872485 RepID=UPI001B40B0EA|nr:choice-of-anchor Q domain-containing protein [Amaricoccus sp.]MBP7000253.1 hypothetical protein [Amaricoccus sp.]